MFAKRTLYDFAVEKCKAKISNFESWAKFSILSYTSGYLRVNLSGVRKTVIFDTCMKILWKYLCFSFTFLVPGYGEIYFCFRYENWKPLWIKKSGLFMLNNIHLRCLISSFDDLNFGTTSVISPFLNDLDKKSQEQLHCGSECWWYLIIISLNCFGYFKLRFQVNLHMSYRSKNMLVLR